MKLYFTSLTILAVVVVLGVVSLVGSGSARGASDSPSVRTGNTVLAFRTPSGAVSIPVGSSRQLGRVTVSPYSQIRLVADERVGSPTNVRLRLTITEGNELVAQLDTPTLAPRSQLTTVYAVPGTTLTVFADALGSGSGSDAVDVLIYGN